MICQASLAKWHLLLFLFCCCHQIMFRKKKNIIRRACYCQFQNDQISKLVILLVQSSNHFKFIFHQLKNYVKLFRRAIKIIVRFSLVTSQSLTISFCNNNILLSLSYFLHVCVLESMTVPRLHMGNPEHLPLI